jgi:hypothetical protein
MRLKQSLAAVLALASAAAFAQLSAPRDPDWREADAPAPPQLRTSGLIELDIRTGDLRFGIDPASIAVGVDGIVRYVVVARGPGGVVNGIYEGVHCKTAQAKVYARHNPDSGWVPVTDAKWKPVHDAPHSRYSLHIARGGVCQGHAPNRNAAQIVRDLKASPDARFATETR